MMMAPTTHVTTGAASGVLKGELGFINDTLAWADGLEETLAETIEDTARMLRTEIRNEARNDPAWADLADVVDVEFRDGSFSYVFRGDPERVQEALDLEFGTQSQTPVSLLRKHSIRQLPKAQESMQLEAPLA